MKLNEKRYYLDKNSWSQLQATYGIKTLQEEETIHGVRFIPRGLFFVKLCLINILE